MMLSSISKGSSMAIAIGVCLESCLICKFTSAKRCSVAYILQVEVNNCRRHSCAPIGNLGITKGCAGGGKDRWLFYYPNVGLVNFFFSFLSLTDWCVVVLCTQPWTWCAYLKNIEYAINKKYNSSHKHWQKGCSPRDSEPKTNEPGKMLSKTRLWFCFSMSNDGVFHSFSTREMFPIFRRSHSIMEKH